MTSIRWSILNLNQYAKDDEMWAEPIALMVAIRTRGGKDSAKQQLHRARAYFDTWLKLYPHYREDFNIINWGKAV